MKHDNAEHQPVEKMTGIRLALIEYAATHAIDELILRALDKIGELVDSAIGFFHFVEADQKTLPLPQWSTRTLNDFCRTESKGLHHQLYYPIEQAGVWADSAGREKPVIHNDYASTEQKQGMPEGHAEVVRELVIPLMRAGRFICHDMTAASRKR
jgi:two-component system, cell cycle sensor histidine kinase and response regulator CckA